MTLQERIEQEERDADTYNELMEEKDPYAYTSNKRNIQIGKKKYSIHWILCYAQARNAGIACMYSSSYYANERMYGCRSVSWETHDIGYESRAVDAKLLARASQYLREHGRYEKPKGKLVLETV